MPWGKIVYYDALLPVALAKVYELGRKKPSRIFPECKIFERYFPE